MKITSETRAVITHFFNVEFDEDATAEQRERFGITR